jgi:hypothetical protein
MASEKHSAEQTQATKKENEKPIVNGVKKDEEEELVCSALSLPPTPVLTDAVRVRRTSI